MTEGPSRPRRRWSLSWIDRDGKLILTTRGVRSFGYGFVSFILGIYLSEVLDLGESAAVGAILSGALIGSAGFTTFVSFYADRLGRKRMLILLAALMALSGIVFVLTRDPVILFIAAAVGTLSPTGAEIGSFLPMEQAILPQCVSQENRNNIFAAYNVVGSLTGAAGFLFGGIVTYLESALNSEVLAFHVMFILYAIIGLSALILYLLLSPKTELQTAVGDRQRQRVSRESKVRVGRLASLFAVDSFAGGFVLLSIISLWFSTKFDRPLSELSLIFFVAGILTTVSYYMAVRIARKIGLLRTMVFTHIPSNVFLILVPLAPTYLGAIALFLARQAISPMDVPTRQSYTVAIVPPEARTFAAGVTSISRNVAQAASPSISTYALGAISNAAPFIIGGSLKIVYDVAVFFSFRHIHPPDESHMAKPRSSERPGRS